MDQSNYSDELSNLALELVTEWGENYGKLIDERIRIKYPELKEGDISALTAIARQVESRIYKLAETELAGVITESDIVPTARREFEWLDAQNAARLKNIGMYYARR